MKRFHEIRIKALESWASVTKRQIVNEFGELTTDNYMGAFECKWQNGFEDGHVNLFCSLGDWGCNVTDILKETKYDYLDLDDEEEAKVLFRYYTRFLLVLSEMLTDFQDIYIHAETLKTRDSKQIARNFYAGNIGKDQYTEVFNFINSVCKHKTQHVHLCNNHNQIIFEDSGVVPITLNYIRLGDVSSLNKNAVLVPFLHHFTNILLYSYVALDDYFYLHPKKFETLCKKYVT